jgi:DNA (cytosine-5)-methyltransferase 1
VGQANGATRLPFIEQSVTRSKMKSGSNGKVCSPSRPCKRCVADQAFLRGQRRPRILGRRPFLTAVDLFAGCGGMTIGLQEAARRAGYQVNVALALDSDAAAIEIYKANLPMAEARVADVTEVFNGAFGAPLTAAERRTRDEVGEVDFLLGGPPCQGHSDLNNHTRRKDPKNALYSRMGRAAEVLLPQVVIIENVTTVQWDEGGVVDATSQALMAAGYTVAARVLDLRRLGVPQRRKRFVLVGSMRTGVDPSRILEQLANAMPDHPDRTVRWAIADLMAQRKTSTYDTASRISDKNAERIDVLFDEGLYDLPNEHRPECHRDGDHSYVSMYGRLRWTRPAQTITTGFGSMGQGRYVHPERRRTLTPHEAARLQTFPDWFHFGDKTRRGVLATVIGNAVPPLLTVELGRLAIPAVVAAREAPRHQRKRA